MTRVTVATAPLITAAQSVRGYKKRQNVSELLADTLYTYQPDRNDTVAPGDIIRTRAEGFSYEVLAAGASGDVATAGGVKLRALAIPGITPAAFGATGSGIETAQVQEFFAFLAAEKCHGVIDKPYTVDGTIRPGGPISCHWTPGCTMVFRADGTYTEGHEAGGGGGIGKGVLFDISGMIGSSITGVWSINTNAATYLSGVIALYAVDGANNSNQITAEHIWIRRVEWPLFQPVNTTGTATLPYSRWVVGFLHTQNCGVHAEFAGPNGLDDTRIDVWRMNRAERNSSFLRGDLDIGTLFLKGGDDYIATAATTQGSAVVTIADHSFQDGDTLAIVGAGEGGVILVGTIQSIAGDDITLDETAGETVAGADVCLAKGGIVLDRSSINASYLYMEGSFIDAGIHQSNGSRVQCTLKLGSGTAGCGFRRGHPVVVAPRGVGAGGVSRTIIHMSDDEGVSTSGPNVRSWVYLPRINPARRHVRVSGLRSWDQLLADGVTPVKYGERYAPMPSAVFDGQQFLDDLEFTSGADGVLFLNDETETLSQVDGRYSVEQSADDGVPFVLMDYGKVVEDQVYRISAFAGAAFGEWEVSTFGGVVSIRVRDSTDMTLSAVGLSVSIKQDSGGTEIVRAVIQPLRRRGKRNLLRFRTVSLDAGWTDVGEGAYTFTGDNSRHVSWNGQFPAGNYRGRFEVYGRTSGNVRPMFGPAGGNVLGDTVATNAFHDFTLTATGQFQFSFRSGNTFVGGVRNVSLVRLP